MFPDNKFSTTCVNANKPPHTKTTGYEHDEPQVTIKGAINTASAMHSLQLMPGIWTQHQLSLGIIKGDGPILLTRTNFNLSMNK